VRPDAKAVPACLKDRGWRAPLPDVPNDVIEDGERMLSVIREFRDAKGSRSLPRPDVQRA
jgi:hypothetical protein